MIETIHIFDDFSQSPDELTQEQRHKKRMELDPLIFDLLKKKYSEKLERFWQTHILPTNPESYIVLVERRIHPNLAFVLYNAAYFARNYGIVLYCSDTNYEYCKKLCGEKGVILLPLFKGNPDATQAKKEYNDLLKSKRFYEGLPGEYHLFLEVDCYIRKPIPQEWEQYDFIAAPYEWDETSCGGGFSFRRKQAMLSICEVFPDTMWAQDSFICEGAKQLKLRIPDFETAITYVTESCIYEDPIGVHQWWTFFFPRQTDDSEEIFQALLSLEID